ncbi:MAG: efflux RND transporter periplasmic adaptor subunit [Filimonas sp.]|nr:efflux RND transporter periplasmic adaptor subunit [Filimonas sp.]
MQNRIYIHLKKYLLICSAVLIVAFVTASCKSKKQPETQVASDTYYTCSMHPQIMQDHPGNCPICGMKLIVAKKTSADNQEIQLSEEQVQLGNIHVDTIRSGMFGDAMVLTGTLNFNQHDMNAVSARVAGRIEHLYYKNIGDYVSKGDKLFDLYSEELNNAKQEYILAVSRADVLKDNVIDYKQLVESAKTKLLLWGMTDAQIAALAKEKKTENTTAVYSNTSGYITSLDVKEGDYVMDGGSVVKLADLHTLWVEAQVYTTQMQAMDANGSVVVKIPDMNDMEINGTIAFANPEINPDTRINLVRITIPNKNNMLKPGMPAYVYVKGKQQKGLALPIDAVLRNGTMSVVWVQTAEHAFRARMIKTGLENGNTIQVLDGLKEGDAVVTSGAYLLNSEFVFKKGTEPMMEHMH